MHSRILLAALLTVATLPAAGEPPHRPVVVELFTSQGCSSCPPADAFLSELARSGADVLPLGFHVTYWNGLGWRDPFSLDAATARQRQYAAQLAIETIYTPQMVVDGQRDVVGSDRRSALAAIRAAAQSARPGPALRVRRNSAEAIIDAGRGSGAATLWVIGYDPEHRTAVARGENAGRSLGEANVVRSLVNAGEWTGAPLHLQLAPPDGDRIAVILQAADGRILGAAIAAGEPAS